MGIGGSRLSAKEGFQFYFIAQPAFLPSFFTQNKGGLPLDPSCTDGDYGDDDDNDNEIAPPIAEDEEKYPSRYDCQELVYQDGERHGLF